MAGTLLINGIKGVAESRDRGGNYKFISSQTTHTKTYTVKEGKSTKRLAIYFNLRVQMRLIAAKGIDVLSVT